LDLIDHYHGRPLGDVVISEVISEALEVAYRHRLKLPQDLYLLARAFVTMEAVGRSLNPRFNVVDIAQPFVQSLLRRKLDPVRVAKRIAGETQEALELLARIPVSLDQALDRLNRGELQIAFQHRGLDRLINRIDIVSNRISFSVIIGALIVGSSLIIQTQRGPLLFDLPLLGVLGYVVAGIFGMGLILSIVRSGRL